MLAHVKKRPSVIAGQTVLHIVMILASLSVILPLVLMVIVSFSSEASVLQYGYSFVPHGWSLDAYRYVFENDILSAYRTTILVTVVGTLLSVIICCMCAYTLRLKKVRHRNFIALFLYFPTLFNAGLIPWYYNISETLKLSNTIFVLILPLLVSSYNIFLIRNYFKTIPDSLIESAEIDGANQFRIFFVIVIPLSVPIIATISLFVALMYWNDWYYANWFINSSNQGLYPLQYYLFKIQSMITSAPGQGSGAVVPTNTTMVAAMFVTIGPIVLLYPFIQRYFIKGIMVGAVKG